jgi:hypothetical protein
MGKMVYVKIVHELNHEGTKDTDGTAKKRSGEAAGVDLNAIRNGTPERVKSAVEEALKRTGLPAK